MSHEDQVFTLLVESNPIPQVEDLDLVDVGGARYLENLEQRSSEMTQRDRTGTQNDRKKKTTPWLVAAAVVVVIGVGVIALDLGGETPVGSPATSTSVAPSTTTTTTVAPAEVVAVIEGYIAAYNGGDVDEVMTYFSEDSVITGHPFDLSSGRSSSSGLAEIRALHAEDIASAASEDAYTISNTEVTGSTVTWDHVWVNDLGNEFCKFGQSAVVEDGVILSWTWAGGGFDCPFGS